MLKLSLLCIGNCYFCFAESTQLRILCKDDIAVLLRQVLPSDWSKGENVLWYPNDKKKNHPPKDWITVVWGYLEKHFSSETELQHFGNLPLIPLSMSQNPVTLTRLRYPSSVVVKRFYDDYIDEAMTNVLANIGLIVLSDCPTFASHHPAVLGRFINPPSVRGVLKAMAVFSSRMTPGMFSEIVRTRISSQGKQVLRLFLANARPEDVEKGEYKVMGCLPVFETVSKKFVSKEDGICAAPLQPFPIPALQDLIDISEEDSKNLAVLLKIRILMPTEFLCELIFPDLQKEKYSTDQIDELMPFVLKTFFQIICTDATFKRKIQELPFVPKQRGRVMASNVFDPRNETLKKIFAHEDVFPFGKVYNDPTVLVVLEELGMKKTCNITAGNLLQSAKLVTMLTNISAAKQKSKAILQYLSNNPQKLLEPIKGCQLGVLLRNICWVSRLQKRTLNFPPSLSWWPTAHEETQRHFFKPTELKSHQLVNLIGTVMPIVESEPSSEISDYFGWRSKPDVSIVVEHLQNVMMSYTKDEKSYYIFAVKEIYSFLSGENDKTVRRAFQSVEVFDWVWNGDGFSSPNHVLYIKPPINLTPYIRPLPSEMRSHSHLFYRFGMRNQSDSLVLLQVLSMIKEKHDDVELEHSPSEVKHDLQLSVDILNELANEELPEVLKVKILLPTHVKENSYVRLEPVERCMYCEHDEWLKGEDSSEDVEYFYVHPNVPNNTAQRLGVPSLTHRMLNPDELFIGEEFGQEERLTTRLNRLLEDYTDGFAVLKELIQNADDAGATEVKFLYDKRTNEDALTCLIDEGMRGCQGPALWVFNDSTFKDEDFVNITKINEATKVHDTEKIGRFGLGFNAVYNLTDVPMFVSRNYFAIFDPHTSYLGKAIKSKRRPGIKIDLNRDVKRLQNFKNQFKPFNGIFGCDLHLDKDENSFDGTLFRFPLRTRKQAAKSEIKDLCYDEREMVKLLRMFLEKSKPLLLFAQNVLRLEVYISSPGSTTQDLLPELMFQVTKSILQGGILRELSVPITLPLTAATLDTEQRRFLKQCNFLQASSKVARKAKTHRVDPSEFPESSIAFDVECSLTESGSHFFQVDENSREECETWFVVSSMGNGQALKFSKSDSSLVPAAGVAVQLKPTDSESFTPIPIVKNVDCLDLKGTIFCYLPLPIHSGLPVHINGSFAVTANRRYLQTKLEDDKTCYGGEWNEILMQDPLVEAFLKLLEDVKQLIPDDGSYVYHSLWPKACDVFQDCRPFMASFYTKIAGGGHPLFSDGNGWADITQVVFLHPNLRSNPQIGKVSFEVFRLLKRLNYLVIDLPVEVFQSFLRCDLWDKIKGKTYDESRFFRDLFFPNIMKVPSHLRDQLVLYALKHNTRDYDELLKKNDCIPVSPSGKTLKCPSQLVNPKKEASFLFSHADSRFPCGEEETFLNPQILIRLEELGMRSSDLPWEDIAERSESIQRLNSKAAAKRVKKLLDFIEKKIKRKGQGPSPDILTRIREAQFLPVLQRPKSFPLPWKGDEFQSLLVAPEDIFLKEKKYLVCCTEPLVDLDIPKRVRELLKLQHKEATAEHVVNQLKESMSTNINTLDCNGYEELSSVCTMAYSFLEDNAESLPSSVTQFLLQERFILIEKEKRFVPANLVAFEASADCSPYLFELPEDLSERFFQIMNISGVRMHFEGADYVSRLEHVKEQFNETQLDERTLKAVVNMADLLAVSSSTKRSGVDPCRIQDEWGTIYLPDSRRVMCDVNDLCFKDCPWMPDDPDEHFVHEKIAWSTSEQLGVKTRREEALQHHDIGLPFGQQEKLTNRLKRILEGYPGEKEILKELVQNADDAGATEIFFIKDPRHHPDERVFGDGWKPLQGPALCVYNNRPFTNADIKGICNLGEGSKGEDPNKTGQYGVGFNAVYHLTDVPSFISKGEEIGDVLCVFDPHCKYIRCSSEAKPGRMFKNIETLKTKFPDIFPCYLEDHFSLKNATMFRFPLKSEKMAQESQISQTAITMQNVDDMMEDLKKELFEVLLFVNNVRKISISAIDKRGKLVNCYCVQVVMSQEDARKRLEFSSYVKEIGKQVKQKNILVTSVMARKHSYTLELQDDCGMTEKWLIVQQVGFQKSVTKSVVEAFKRKKLGMLPRGGVASVLESTSKVQRRKKAYCFLPLPLRTKLPVHVNGHFALDHETRRNLWTDEAGGYQSDWNNALLCDVITSCYLTLLDEVRGLIQLPVKPDSAHSVVTCSKSTMFTRLCVYEELFPRYPFEEQHWKTLADSVYREMDTKGKRLIPLVRSLEVDSCGRSKDSEGSERVQVTWLLPTGTGKDRTYFNNLGIKGCFAPLPPRRDEKEEDLKRREEARLKRIALFEEILLETGFNLVALSMTVFHSFKEAGVEVCCVSPSAVIDFFKSFSDDDPLCRIGAIPCPVGKTLFKNPEGVICVLKYCKDAEDFQQNLCGLPLLLTHDNHLHAFSERQPRCLSRYTDILPYSGALFVHDRVRFEVFNSVNCRNVAVFRSLDIETFASHLRFTLPPCFLSKDHYERWYPDEEAASLPSRRWIYRVWDFLQEFTRDALEGTDVDEERRTVLIRHLLFPLSNWSLLPATETIQCSLNPSHGKQTVVNHCLVPLHKAESVLDFRRCGTSNETLVDALRKLGLPELNSAVLTTPSIATVLYSKQESYELAHSLVATIKSPHSLLVALGQKLQQDPISLDEKLEVRGAMVILDYFSRNTERLPDADKDILRKLPFYPRTNGALEKLEEKKTFVLPDEIPVNEMSVVEESLGCLFLKSDQRLSDLYEFLEVKSLTPFEVYTNFVLKCFQYLSLEGTLIHLRYIRDFISSARGMEKESERNQKAKLFEYLKNLEVIPTTDGTLKTASSFYDPDNEVFSAVLSEDSFPPKPFDTDEWLPFLKKIGLVHDVSQEKFLEFAYQVEREAGTARTKDTYQKSKILVHHLIFRPNVLSEGLLPLARDIAFVAADPVDERLQVLFPPFRETESGEIPFIAFSGAVVNNHEKIVWTEAHLLPSWADPRNYSYYFRDQDLNDLLAQLQVLTMPSVDLVVSHCQTICYHLGSGNSDRDRQSSTIRGVMQSIYSFLQENAMQHSKARMLLQRTRCVLVDRGTRFIFPRQAVLEMYESLEIKPFLYRIPAEFGVFQPLFEFLECSKNVTPIHYAMVLEILQKNCQSASLHPNEKRWCFKAVKGFFDSLQDGTPDLSTLSKLYLPAMLPGSMLPASPNTPLDVTLQESTDLLFDDAPSYSDRIRGLNQPFVLELSLMGVSCKSALINFKELMIKLPQPVQPKMLSVAVKEKLSDPENTVIVSSGMVNALKQRLSSVHFTRGIARIIIEANSQNKDFDKGVISSIDKGLRGIELLAVESLRTSLLQNDLVIPGSEDEVWYFKEKLDIPGGHMWRVYVNGATGTGSLTSLSILVAKIIIEMYGEYLGINAYIIPDMLRCPSENISSLLDSLGIRKDDSYGTVKMNLYPQPGTLIPLQDHHLLNDAFEEFEPGEYVGFQLHDPSLELKEGSAVYIYAIIIEEVTTEDSSLLKKLYRIDIGPNETPALVNAADLYKFCRPEDIFDEKTGCHRNKQEVLDEISNMLKEAWELDLTEEERRQIVKRLCLRWHPKKNSGNEEFYRAIFQHIQSEVSQLGGSYDDFFASWGERAGEHGSNREEYRRTFHREYGPGHRSWPDIPPSFCARNPQPAEAKRWFRQAEADLEAGRNEFGFSSHSFEWICFKCHQVNLLLF